MTNIQKIYNQTLLMKPVDKIKLIEMLISSINLPNCSDEIEKEWNKEIEDRLKAYNDGKIKTISANKVFSKYGL